MPLDDQIITVIVREENTPLPPAYPDPLIYTVSYQAEVDLSQMNTEDVHTWLREEVAKKRAADLGVETDLGMIDLIAEGLSICFAFRGDQYPLLDFRI